MAVSILGATISPYLYFFYSSGAIEDEWKETHVGINRIIATAGMTFGSVISMALTAATLPVSIVPFLFLMNDYSYVRVYRNGWISNAVVIVIIGIAFVLAVVSIPLQIFGGG